MPHGYLLGRGNPSLGIFLFPKQVRRIWHRFVWLLWHLQGRRHGYAFAFERSYGWARWRWRRSGLSGVMNLHSGKEGNMVISYIKRLKTTNRNLIEENKGLKAELENTFRYKISIRNVIMPGKRNLRCRKNLIDPA